MVKKILFLGVTAFSLSSMAQNFDCHQALLNNQGDSASYRLTTSEFDAGPSENLDQKSAVSAAKKVLEKSKCHLAAAKVMSSCSEIKKGSNRLACLVEVEDLPGFFTVVNDYVDTFYVIYSRLD